MAVMHRLLYVSCYITAYYQKPGPTYSWGLALLIATNRL